jgi:N-acetylmuramoyl-L-alanine amidase
MRRVFARALGSGACCVLLAGCPRATPAPVPGPAPGDAPVSAPVSAPGGLPPIPLVDGPLAVRVQYPSANALIASRDSNFIFGSVGSGRATLEINGVAVPVQPNGAFIAYLAVPPAESPQYALRATRDADTSVVTHLVRLLAPSPVLADTGRLVVDSGSVLPRGTLQLRGDERVRVAVRAPRNATVVATWTGGSQPLIGGDSLSVAVDPAARVPAPRDPLRRSADIPASALTRAATIVITRGADTVRLPLATMDPDTATSPRLAMLGAPAAASGDSDKVVVGRSVPDPSGASRWFLLPGTVVQTTGRMAGYTRVRVDALLEIWVEDAEVTPLRAGAAAPRPTILSTRIAPAADWVDLVLPLGEPIPFLVEEQAKSLVLTLYGAKVSMDAIAFAANDSLIRTITSTQVTSDRAQLTLNLDAAPYGYQTLWDNGRFILRVRRPPAIDRSLPLRGLLIAVDAGHPPIGATGPTGLYEGDAVLEVAMRLRTMLEARGATVFMTRTDREPVALADRPILARRANAHAFVSIHLNAYPDGVNPFVANGTGTYFYFEHSERLARAVQRGLVPELGLRNIGVFQQSFAVIRNSWMPAVLAEGAFVIIPEQEAALRTAAYQEAYARGILHGLEAYFRGLREP